MASVLIRITQGDSGYTVTLAQEQGQKAESTLSRDTVMNGSWPPSRILQRIGEVDKSNRNHSDFARIAEALYDWLLPAGPVRDLWTDLDRTIMPRLLLDIQVDALALLPWELTSTDWPALTNGMYRLAKVQEVLPQASSWPFRILVVVGAKQEEQEQLGIAEEVTEIERTFLPLGRTVDVQRLDQPDKPTLMDWVRTFHPHVFHFAGHGGRLPGASEGGLRFDPPGKPPWMWSGSDIRVDLRAWRWVPRFVFLNACRSAAEHEGSWSVQRGFLDRGTQAALGMQADIRGDYAGKFASTLYKLCAEGKTLEDAVFESRQKISASLASNQYIDWALPALASSTPGLKLLEPQPPLNLEFEQCREFQDARLFADCREPRRNFTHWVYPADNGSCKKSVLLVQGESRCGKSHLLKWCMETWALGGARVRYVELHGQSQTLLDVLRQIREGEIDGTIESQYLHHPLPPSAFKRFRWELKNIIEKNEPGEWIEADHPVDTLIPDTGGVLPARSDKRLEPIVCARFSTALKAAAGGRPLILVFDRLGGPNNERTLSPIDFEQLILHLFLPIANEVNSIVKLAFGASSSEFKDYKLGLLSQASVHYPFPIDIPDEKLAELAAEAVWFRNETQVKDLARTILGLSDNHVRGLGRLNDVFDTVKRLPLSAGVRVR